MKKAGLRLLIPAGLTPRNVRPGNHQISVEDKSMNFDPQIVAQAKAFVNDLRTKGSARVPALKLEHWQQFMTQVYAGLGLA